MSSFGLALRRTCGSFARGRASTGHGGAAAEHYSTLFPGQREGGLRGNGVIAIRRENKNRWERRAPISPSHVKHLVQQDGVKVIVQPSSLRAFADVEYAKAGAVISEDISPASLIIGVKEVPVKELIPNRTYMFFSHTHKAQPYNMAMLDAILDKDIRLVDYEKMIDEKGARVVKFGNFAGVAGMIDFLHGLGDRMLGLGYHTPFLYVGFSHSYSRIEHAMNAIKMLGHEIATNGIAKELAPVVIGFTGDGAVSKGAQHIFKSLPHKWITVDELPAVVKQADPHTIYGVIINSPDYIVPLDRAAAFDKRDYYKNPHKYASVFHTKVAPYLSAIVNGIYWEQKYPRLLTNAQVEELAADKKLRLLGIADISADPNGSIEFMTQCTSIDEPFLVYDVEKKVSHRNMEGKGVMILSVDNLPAELPIESSEFFGNLLSPYLPKLAFSDGSKPFAEQADLDPVVRRAVITSNGALTPNFAYISQLRAAYRAKQKKVLLLGAGLVAAPLVDYLKRFSDTIVTVASVNESEAKGLANDHPRVFPKQLNVQDKASLEAAVLDHDLVVSFVPATMHPIVAEVCVAFRKHMVTASYISPAMKAFDESAKSAGITILNEIGLDPGIDHLSAMKIIDEARASGSKVKSFVSWCGGLPAPENSDNPFGYKFSWSPRGVLSAGLNSARYRKDHKLVEIQAGQLFRNAQSVDIYSGFALEGLPNRDSLSYSDVYRIPDAETMFRGTLRYKGFSNIMSGLKAAGLFDTAPTPILDASQSRLSWRQVMHSLVPDSHKTSDLEGYFHELVSKTHPNLSPHEVTKVVKAFSWLGLFSEAETASLRGTYIDTLCALMEKKMAYQKGERDLVILHHDILISRLNDKHPEHRQSTLIAYGDPEGYTAMAKTVALPAAIATRLILDGTIKRKGVLAPVTKDIYEPLLRLLEAEGIVCNERTL